MLAPETIEAPLFDRFRELGITATIHRHSALHTVAESKALRGELPGAHIKNLFLRDKKRRFWLLTVMEDRPIDLKGLRHSLGATGNLSFASADRLRDMLGVDPGAVTPFAVVNDFSGRVRAVLDRALAHAEIINAHPLHNRATTTISAADLIRFMTDCGHPPVLMDF